MTPDKIEHSLNISWKEGIPASLMLGIMDYYLIPYALFLGATTQQVGLLVAIPHLMASIAQLFAVRAVRIAGSRLRFLVRTAFAQAALLLPMAVLALFPISGRIELLIGLVIVFRVSGNLVATAWGSLMSDYLAPEKRGHYFGWRSQVVGLAALAGVALAGLFLYFMKGIFPALGFFLLFLAASCLRFISVSLLSKMSDLPLPSAPESDFTFFEFLGRLKESNFVKFVLYTASITFGTFLAAPYFSVYMLRDLHFSYLSYMFVTIGAVISGLIAFPIWGKHADLVGNARVLKLTSFLIPVIPLLWLFSKHPMYLFAVEFYAGFVWVGFNLCATNFIYDAVSPEKRVRCLGYFTLINGVAIFAGSSLGGFLAGHLPLFWGYQLFTLFMLSAFVRFLAHFFLSPHFREVRESTRQVSSMRLFFSVIGVRPLEGLNREWNFFPSNRDAS